MARKLRRQPELVWEGHYLDGRSALRQDVRVEVTAGGLILAGLPGGDELVWAYDAIRQTQGFHPREVVRFELNDSGEALVVPDPAVLSAIHALAGGFSHRFHNPRMRRYFWPGVLASSLA
ncbi:MAG: hypothetical protein FJZ00_09260, partial [Candidatus Sericytochromatia bacterium]|nr:hypothetical protein [Candidatus Tanganyikabacteria bacterium]